MRCEWGIRSLSTLCASLQHSDNYSYWICRCARGTIEPETESHKPTHHLPDWSHVEKEKETARTADLPLDFLGRVQPALQHKNTQSIKQLHCIINTNTKPFCERELILCCRGWCSSLREFTMELSNIWLKWLSASLHTPLHLNFTVDLSVISDSVFHSTQTTITFPLHVHMALYSRSVC